MKTRALPSVQNQVKTEMKTVLNDSVLFARWLAGYAPFEYQKRFLRDDNQLVIFKTGRQTGKTTYSAIKAIHTAITRANQTVLIVSPTQRQSSIMFWRIRSLVTEKDELCSLVTRETLTSLFFSNGSKIYALPAGRTGDTIRGYTATTIIFDEASFIPPEVFGAVKPALATTQGQLFLLSTPFGKQGAFWEAWNNPLYSKHEAKSEDNPLITVDFLKREAQQLTEMEYRQEYGGEFLDTADNYFERALISACSFDEQEIINYKPALDKEYYLGVDVARYGLDETVFTVAEYDGKKYRVVRVEATNKKPATDTLGRVKHLNEEFNFTKVFVDETGLGGAIVDELRETIPETEGVTFTLETKQELYKNLKWLMEKGLITYPNNRRLISQLSQLEYEFTSNGRMKVHHPDHPNAHDDYCFVAGTRVLTERGQVPIEEVVVGDLVRTRAGFNRVVATGSRLARVVTRFGLTGTPCHPVFTTLGLKPLSLLSTSDITYIWNEKQSSIEEKRITATQPPTADNSASTTGRIQTGRNRPARSTEKSGKTTTGKSREDTQSTTETTTQTITRPKTSSAYRAENTNARTRYPLNELRPREETSLNTRDQKQSSGTNQLLDANGTRNTVNILGKHGLQNERTARNAGKNSTTISNERASALKDVNNETGLETNARVYNLKVEGDNPEYFANGILVHNCDSLALAVFNNHRHSNYDQLSPLPF